MSQLKVIPLRLRRQTLQNLRHAGPAAARRPWWRLHVHLAAHDVRQPRNFFLCGTAARQRGARQHAEDEKFRKGVHGIWQKAPSVVRCLYISVGASGGCYRVCPCFSRSMDIRLALLVNPLNQTTYRLLPFGRPPVNHLGIFIRLPF